MVFYEFALAIRMKKEVPKKAYHHDFTRAINYCMNYNSVTRKVHTESGMKLYSWVIKNIKKTKVLYVGKSYMFIFRCVNKELADSMADAFSNVDNEVFGVDRVMYMTEVENDGFMYLTMTTETPVVITIPTEGASEGNPQKYGVGAEDIDVIRKQINTNLCRKMHEITGLEYDGIEPVEYIRPLYERYTVVSYKNGSLPCQYYAVSFWDDPTSREMAQLARCTGIGEKNSLGFGLCEIVDDFDDFCG